MEKTWTPNERQTQFMKVLASFNGEEKTLAEINEKAVEMGYETFKTGTINTLTSKGLVANGADREVIVKAKRTVKTYKLEK